MYFNFNEIAAQSRYKLLIGTVVPRPIAWVTSFNREGKLNAAPFSFFNVFGSDPGLVILSVGNHPDRPKDTASNIEREKEFVVNLVPFSLAEQMSLTATDFPGTMSEVEIAGLKTTPSHDIKVPRLADCPVAMECRLHSIQHVGNNRLVLGEIVSMHIVDEMMLNVERFYVDSNKLDLVGRMGGLGGYVRTDHPFEIERTTFAEWSQENTDSKS